MELLRWICICLALSLGLDCFIRPNDSFYSALIYLLPFVVFGFQCRLLDREPRVVIGMPLYSDRMQFMRLTFWGIPISSARIRQNDSGLVYDFYGAVRKTPFFPIVLSKFVNNR